MDSDRLARFLARTAYAGGARECATAGQPLGRTHLYRTHSITFYLRSVNTHTHTHTYACMYTRKSWPRVYVYTKIVAPYWRFLKPLNAKKVSCGIPPFVLNFCTHTQIHIHTHTHTHPVIKCVFFSNRCFYPSQDVRGGQSEFLCHGVERCQYGGGHMVNFD